MPQIRPPRWMRVTLLPLGWVVFVLLSPFVMLGIVAICVVATIQYAFESRRFERRMRRAGRLLPWADVCARLDRREGTLLMEMTPKGMGRYAWWLPQSREELDPQGVLPTLRDDPSPAAPHDRQAYECIDRWAAERLIPVEHAAMLTLPGRDALTPIAPATRRERTLLAPFATDAAITPRAFRPASPATR